VSMSRVINLNHVAILVQNLDRSLNFWRDMLGIQVSDFKDVSSESARIAFLPIENGMIELVQPLDEKNSLSRYLSRHGPGLHHVCLEVDDIQAMLSNLKNSRVRLINDTPITGEDGRKYAFIHPESTSGVLLELYELP